MGQERELPYQTENIGYTFSISYLAKARTVNGQFQLDQELGLTSKKEKEIFNLYLAERLLRNEVRLVIANQNNLHFPQKIRLLVEGASFIKKRAEKLKEQIDPKRAGTIYTAISDLSAQVSNKDPNSTSFQPTQETLALWKNKWAPQLVPKKLIA